jgi:hypothetical protein
MFSTIFHEMIDFGTGTALTPWDVDNERWDGTRNGGTGHKRWDGTLSLNRGWVGSHFFDREMTPKKGDPPPVPTTSGRQNPVREFAAAFWLGCHG